MNPKQRMLIFGIVGVVALMLLFPPFQRMYSGSQMHAGYMLVINSAPLGHSVNVFLLMAQIAAVLMLGALVYYALGRGGVSGER